MSPNITYADWLEHYAAYPYKTATIKRYVSILEAVPEKLNLSLPRGIMEIDDPDEFENACIAVATSDGYEQLNKSRHGELSTAMAAYRKYLAFVGKVSAAGGTGRVHSPEWFHAVAQTEEMISLDEEASALQKEFCDAFSVEKLTALSGRDLLTRLFYSDEENKNNLCYMLEFHPRMRELFGSIAGGSSFKYGLFYHKKSHSWMTGSPVKPHMLTEEEAIDVAGTIRDKLVAGAKLLGENAEKLVTVDAYEKLYQELRSVTNIDWVWVLKYYQMLFPDLLPVFYAKDIQIDVLRFIHQEPSSVPFVRMGQIAIYIKSCGISSPVFGRIYAETYPPYSADDFLADVYMEEDDYSTLVNLLRTKKNIILQGAPGVGKTYAAKRLAYSMMGVKDQNRVMMVQFHQSYSYEDFIEGYRPASNGFVLNKGAFYKFCRAAEMDDENEYFFIIDEINRGNLSKIFGELFMLIESDKRGIQLQLLYSGEKFAVPKNVYIIGMMNTADRSLAMLDYALRRRFAFYEMRPGFDTDGFRTYRMGLDSEKFDRLIHCVESLNHAIAADESLGDGFCIGHSYFGNLTAEKLTDRALSAIVEYELIPLLKEYWFDEPLKVKDWTNKLRSAVK